MKNKFPFSSIKTDYKGITFKSRLEAEIALMLDKLRINWQYEPKSFLLSNGHHYWPDFFLPELNTWIEGKGGWNRAKIQYEDYLLFCKEMKTELILIGNEFSHFFSNSLINNFIDKDDETTDENLQLGHCSECGSWFFCGNVGIFSCRKCKSGDGDHDISFWMSNNQGLTYIQNQINNKR